MANITRQRNNENAAKFFAAGMVGMILLFTVFHWSRFALRHYESKRAQRVGFLRIPVRISRQARSLLLSSVPGFTSGGHTLVFIGYIATCITVSFVHIDWSTLNNWAKRLGWVALSNVAFATFLSLKNTPVGFLTGYSHERLNVLHRLSGYCTVFWAMLHAVVYITAWAKSDSLPQLLERDQVVGIIAGFAMLIILASVLIRKLRYEVFYIIHITMFMLMLITLGMHRPQISTHSLIIVIFTACIWVLDRAIRFLTTASLTLGNTASLTPLPNGGTRITLRRAPRGATTGSHCFLWIPAIRAAESHPFTIVSTAPLEFVVAARDGFTRDLHALAELRPGQPLRASIHGPYGGLPDFTTATRVLLIAGGSGASFTLGVAVDLVRRLRSSTRTTIDIIWAIRDPELLHWYAPELLALSASPLVTIHIYNSRSGLEKGIETPSSEESPISEKTSIEEKSPIEEQSPLSEKTPIEEKSPLSEKPPLETSAENPPPTTLLTPPHLPLIPNRPPIHHLITTAIHHATAADHIAVAVCGPPGMLLAARGAVAGGVDVVDGPGVELHCEAFGA